MGKKTFISGDGTRPAQPRSRKLRGTVAVTGGGVTMGGGAGQSEVTGHTHTNLGSLDRIGVTDEGYVTLAGVDADGEPKADKAKAGYADSADEARHAVNADEATHAGKADKADRADVAHDLDTDSPVNDRFLSKTKDDRTGHDLAVGGDFTAEKGTQFGPSFAGGATGHGGRIDDAGNGELESLSLRRFLEVPELRYNRVEVTAGNAWRASGGGVVESVTVSADGSATGTVRLHLEPGEVGAVDEGDICQGIFHDALDESTNATADSDDSRGNFTFAGFKTVYFRVTAVRSVNGGVNNEFDYALRPVSARWNMQHHPMEGMSFAGYGSFTNPSRRTSRYSTRTYERFLSGVNDWEITDANIAAQFGDLSNLAVFGIQMAGYSAYLSNIYLSGGSIKYFEMLPVTVEVDDRGVSSLAEGESAVLRFTAMKGFQELSPVTWSVTRDSGNATADAAWTGVVDADGCLTLVHGDLGKGATTLFTVTATATDPDKGTTVTASRSVVLRDAATLKGPKGDTGASATYPDNLLTGTRGFTAPGDGVEWVNLDKWTDTGELLDGLKVFRRTEAWSGIFPWQLTLDLSRPYTFSCWVRANLVGETRALIYLANGREVYCAPDRLDLTELVSDGEWHRVSVTTRLDPSSVPSLIPRVELTASNGSELYVAGYRLAEGGTTNAQWTPAPSEVRGDTGAPAKVVHVTGGQIFTYRDGFKTLVSPQEITLKAELQGTAGYTWSYRAEGQTGFTVFGDGKAEVTIHPDNTAYFPAGARQAVFRCTSADGAYDEITIAKVSSGSDGAGYTPNLLLKSNVRMGGNTSYRFGLYDYAARPVPGKTYTLTMKCSLGAKDSQIAVYWDNGHRPLGVFVPAPGGEVISMTVVCPTPATGHESDPLSLYRGPSDGDYDTDTAVEWAVLTEGETPQTAWIPAASEMVGQRGSDYTENLLRKSQGPFVIGGDVIAAIDRYKYFWDTYAYLEQGKRYTVSAKTDAAVFSGLHTPTVASDKCVLFLAGVYSEGSHSIRDHTVVSGDDMAVDGSKGYTFTWDKPTGWAALRANFYLQGVWKVWDVKVEEGENPAPAWTPSSVDMLGVKGDKGDKGDAGTDAYTVLLSNESHIFQGDTEKPLKQIVACDIIAYKGATRVPSNIGIITGPPGMNFNGIDNGETTNRLEITVWPTLTERSGVVDIPITVDDKSFTRQFSWTVALEGKGYASNLLLGTKDPRETTGGTNYRFARYRDFEGVTTFKTGEEYTVNVEGIEVVAGAPVEFTARLFDFTAGNNHDISTVATISKAKPYVTLRITENHTVGESTSLLIYAGVAGQTGANTVRFSRVMLTRGTQPSAWSPAESELAGTDAVLYSIVPSVSAIRREASGEMSPAEVSATVYRTEGAGVPQKWSDGVLKMRRTGIDSGLVQIAMNEGQWGVTQAVSGVEWVLYDTSGNELARVSIPVIADGNCNAVNMLPGTASGKGWWGNTDGLTVNNGVFRWENPTPDEYSYYSPLFKLEHGKWYTLSMWASSEEFLQQARVLVLRWNNATSNHEIPLGDDDLIGSDEEWTRKVWHFRVDTPTADNYQVRLNIYGVDDDEPGVLEFKGLMLEEGYNTAPDWRPNDSDLKDTGIDIKNRKIVVTADNFVVENNIGQRTMAVTADGKISASVLDVNGVIAQFGRFYDSSTGDLMSAINSQGQGEYIVFWPGNAGKVAVPRLRFANDDATNSAIQYYSRTGELLWTLGDTGEITRSADKYTLRAIGVVEESHPDIRKPVNLTATKTIYQYISFSEDIFVGSGGSARYKDFNGKFLDSVSSPLDRMLAGQYLKGVTYYDVGVIPGLCDINGNCRPTKRQVYAIGSDGVVTAMWVQIES